MKQTTFEWSSDWNLQRPIYSVSQLTAAIRALFEESLPEVWVAGEISGARAAPSGHVYFTLKDDAAQLKCALFKSSARFLRFKPQDGLAVVARGRLDVYEARGEYQLIVEHLEPRGFGALQLAFEQLKKKLAEQGLFDAERKRPLPRFPRRVGIVTSPAGAAIQDMISILGRRWPGIEVRLFPVLVQGAGSVEEVCRGIEHFSESGWADLVIVGRGGGSMEDLWTFNEEPVALAIAACSVPVISAVGHETDFTIADFVADLRAPTPSAAAELAVPDQSVVLAAMDEADARLTRAARYRVSREAERLAERGTDRARLILERRLGRAGQTVDDMMERVGELLRAKAVDRNEALEALARRLGRLDVRVQVVEGQRRWERLDAVLMECGRRLASGPRARWEALRARVEALSPVEILGRGYAIVENEGRLVRHWQDAPQGAQVAVRLAVGSLKARVESTGPG